jgi:hypothetical protein
MPENPMCLKCGRECDYPCEAMQILCKIYEEARTSEKVVLIKELRKELDIIDYEVADDLKELGEKVITAMPELGIIRDFNIKVGYVRSYERKIEKGKIVYADCRKVKGTYTAYLPFDFIITFYEPNVALMTENQKKILMLHELKHIGVGEKGLKLEDHDSEDFKDILHRYGIDWNDLNQDVPDILLVGGDGEKGTKGHKLETKRKANRNGRTPSKP